MRPPESKYLRSVSPCPALVVCVRSLSCLRAMASFAEAPAGDLEKGAKIFQTKCAPGALTRPQPAWPRLRATGCRCVPLRAVHAWR